jgi:hypothetical protein
MKSLIPGGPYISKGGSVTEGVSCFAFALAAERRQRKASKKGAVSGGSYN